MPPTSFAPHPKDARAADEWNADLFDYALVRDYAVLLLTSPLRRLRLFFSVFVTVVTITLVALFTLPKSYTAETQILAARTGGRYRPVDDSPMRGAVETVLSQSNFEMLVQQTHLVESFEKTLSPAARLKEYAFTKLFGRPTEEDLREGMVATLEKKIHATLVGDNVLVISATWQNREAAFQLATAAQENFISSKEASGVSDLNETLAILSSHATSVRTEIDQELERLRASLARFHAKAPAAPHAPRAPAVHPKPVTAEPSEHVIADSQLQSLQAVLLAKRRDVEEVEQSQQRRLAAVTQELAHLRQIYTDQNPQVIDALQRQAALQIDSPQLIEMKGDVELLEKQIVAAGGQAETTASTSTVRKPLVLPREVTAMNATGDPELDYEAEQLRMLSAKYNSLLDRIDTAHIDLEMTQAAFKQRFIIMRPAQLPIKADNLKPPMVIGTGLGLGLFLALFVCAAVELLFGRIERKWQIERMLQIPVLAQFEKE